MAPVPVKSVNPCFPQGDSRPLAQASNKLELKYDIMYHYYEDTQELRFMSVGSRLKARGSQPNKHEIIVIIHTPGRSMTRR